MRNLTIFLFILLLGISGLTNAQGQFKWAKKIDCSQAGFDNYSRGIEKRGDSLYVLTSSGNNHDHGFQFAKYDLSGNEIWWHSPETNSLLGASFESLDMDVDSSGNMYALVDVSLSDLIFAGDTITYVPDYTQICLVKVSSTGQELWVKAFPVTNVNIGEYELKVTSEGVCYLSGNFSGSLTVDNTTIYGGTNNTYAAKVSPVGTLNWIKHVHNTHTGGNSLDSDENFYVRTAQYMTKYDSSGTQVFQNQYFSGSGMGVYDFDIDSAGNQQLLIYQNTFNYSYGTMSSQTNSGEALLLAKFDSNGNYTSISKIYDTLGLNELRLYDLKLDGQGKAYMYGRTYGAPFSAGLDLGGYDKKGFLILCTDLDGNEIWLKNFSDFSYNDGELTDIFVGDEMIYTSAYTETWSLTVTYDSITYGSDYGQHFFIAGMENPSNYLSGTVFNDANGNGLQDFGEDPVPNQYVSLPNAGGMILTDSAGNYQLFTGNGPITIRMDSLDNSWFTTIPYNPSEHTISSLAGNQTIGGLDFGITNGTVSGTVYYDDNNNCVMDAGEQPMENEIILILPDSIYTATNHNGFYTVGLDIGSYQIQNLTNLGSYQLQNCAVPTFTDSIDVLNISDQFNDRDFANSLIPDIYDLQVTATSVSAMRPGFNATINLTYRNVGTENITSGEIGFDYDSSLTYISSTNLPDGTFQDSLAWNFSNLSVGESRSINVSFTVDTNINLLGDTLYNTAYANSVHSDQDTSNNISHTRPIVTGAYDPNDKQAVPTGLGSLGYVDPTTELLTYTIRFQNTGSDTAFNVVISDTLSQYLDPLSIDILAASHPYVFDISGTGDLQFTFPDIMLPDSNINESASHGFIKFSIRLIPGLELGTTIENTAFIFFDFNPPIITNTKLNTLYDCTNLFNGLLSGSVCENEEFIFASGLQETTLDWNITGVDSGSGLEILWLADTVGTFPLAVQATNSICSIDSTISLTVHPITSLNVLDTIAVCYGDSLNIFSQWQNTTGLYTLTETSVNGCDSIIAKQLNILPAIDTTWLDTIYICAEDSALVFGSYETEQNVYSEVLSTNNGCDSVVVRQLNVLPAIDTTWLNTVYICAEDSALVFGSYETEQNVYSDIYSANNGCDSTVNVQLIIHPDPIVQFDLIDIDTLCADHAPLILSGGSPSGGIFLGSGVIGSEFDPSVAGIGEHYLSYRYEDTNGCIGIDSTSLIVDGCLNVEENELFSITIHPNPFSNETIINYGRVLKGNYALHLINSMGEIVLSKESVEGDHTVLKRGDLSNGVYILKMFSRDTSQVILTKRLVVQ